MRIDLHIHSTASDGALSPTEVVRAAKRGGLDVIALTDHDTAAGIAEAIGEAGEELVVVPGIEVSSTHAGAELHFLGYFVDPTHAALHDHRSAANERRLERLRGMIARLAELGIDIDYEEVVRAAGGDAVALGRPHLARALVEHGYVDSIYEAFDRFLADGGPAFLPTELLTPRQAIDLIHQTGGIAVWAHPPATALASELRRFVSWGLDGLECFRPRNTHRETRTLLRAARLYGLVVTGGSDWHGEWNGDLGTFAVTNDQVAAFLERGNELSV